VNDDLASKSGSWELSAAGERTMESIAQQLAPYQTRPIFINGYTDNPLYLNGSRCMR
jgi:flagellar motor protein MotB